MPHKKQPPQSFIIAAAHELGMSKTTAAEHKSRIEADAKEMHAALDATSHTPIPVELDSSDRTSSKHNRKTGHKVLKAVTLAGALTVAAGFGYVIKDQTSPVSTSDKNTLQPGEAPSETGKYTVKRGDTLWDITRNVHLNEGGSVNDELRPEFDDLIDRVGGTDITIGQQIELPVAADVDPEKPGIQLK